jgi:hypothetical protein
MKPRSFAAILCLGGLLFAVVAQAHKASTSYLHVRADGSSLAVQWDIAVRDLDYAIGLDANGDAAVTWGEIKGARARIADYALARLTIGSAAGTCNLALEELKVVEHSDGHYAVLYLRGTCREPITALDIDYRLLFDLDALHRGLAGIEFGAGSPRSALFAPDAHVLHFDRSDGGTARVFGQYFKAGLFHVWSGLDHMLFLAGLFLPAVVRREKGRWVVVRDLRTAVRDTAFIVTAFTLAHALTLSLAATGAFTLPSRWVESAVALTVCFAGLNNLVPMVYRALFWLSAGFGLIHGAAVASALIDLGLPPGERAWALLAFNLGVEAAQLTLLVAVILPSYALRKTAGYRTFVVLPGSALVALVGLCWFIERAFGVYFGVPLP